MPTKYFPRYFKPEEFKCRCGKCDKGFRDMDPNLLRELDSLREKLGVPIYINSSIRCPSHNAAVGGAPKSQHITGNAVDIRAKGLPPSSVSDILKRLYPDSHGIGLYNTFTHFDNRPNKARW